MEVEGTPSFAQMDIIYKDVFGKVLPMDDLIEKQREEETKEFSESEKSVLDKYKRLEEKKEVFELMFTGASSKGNLFVMDSGVKVVLTHGSMTNEMKGKVSEGRSQALKIMQEPIKVMVSGYSFNSDVPVVFVSCIKIENSRRQQAKETLALMIKNKDYTKIPAKVIRVDIPAQQILLDIGGYGIKGICRFSDWTNSVLHDTLVDLIKPDMIVQVSVVDKIYKKTNKEGDIDKIATGAYRCIRKKMVDPFDTIEQLYPAGTSVLAKAVKCEKSHCFMQIDGYDDVQLLCFYPWLRDKEYKNNSIERIEVGHVYSVIISQCDAKKKRFRGRILKEIDTLTDTVLADKSLRTEIRSNGRELSHATPETSKEV